MKTQFDTTNEICSAAEWSGNNLTLFDRVGEIKRLWADGASSTLKLARLLCAVRTQLPYGEWTQLWKLGQMPFSKRKGEMLVAIGDGMGWADAKIFAHLPLGWSVLYQLAKLGQKTLERLIEEGVIHPRLTLREARELVVRFQGKTSEAKSPGACLRERLRRFEGFVSATLGSWTTEERQLVLTRLTQLAALVGSPARVGFRPNLLPKTDPRHVSAARQANSQPLFSSSCRENVALAQTF